MKSTLATLVLVTGFAWPLAVRAQNRPSELADHWPDSPPATLELDAGWFTDHVGDARLHALSPSIGARLAISQALELELQWPAAYLDVSGPAKDSTLRSGNPFAALYLVKHQRHGYFRIGAGVAVPIARISHGDGRLFSVGSDPGTDRLDFAYARAIRGMWDAWLYFPDQLSIVVPVRLEANHGGLLIGADGAAALFVPTNRKIDPRTDVLFQAAGTLGLRVGLLSLGGRLQAVWSPTNHGDAQLAVAPFAQADFDGGGFLYARYLINLDEPLGVFGHGSDVWGLFLGGGSRF